MSEKGPPEREAPAPPVPLTRSSVDVQYSSSSKLDAPYVRLLVEGSDIGLLDIGGKPGSQRSSSP